MDIRAKLNTYIEKIDDRQRYYIFGGILLFIFVVDYLLIMRPQLGALAKINPEIEKSIEDLNLTNENIAKTGFYKKEAEKLKELVGKADQSIKNKTELPLIFQNISLIADKNKIKIDQISPSSFDQKEILKIQNRRYLSFPIKIRARAGYHDFGRFLNELENGKMFLNVEDFSIVATSDLRHHAVELTVSAVIYEE